VLYKLNGQPELPDAASFYCKPLNKWPKWMKFTRNWYVVDSAVKLAKNLFLPHKP